MEVQTFRPIYQPKAERERATKNDKEFDYRRMRIRADLIARLDALRPENKTPTAFINLAVASFLNTRNVPINTIS